MLFPVFAVHFGNFGPIPVLVHESFEGERLQIGGLVERDEIVDEF